MKSIKRIMAVVVACVAIAVPASAQLAFGIKAGAKINDLKFDSEVLDVSNRAGFTGGVMAEFTLPVLGIGVDASLMYVYSPVNGEYPEIAGISDLADIDFSGSYLEIPINLKYKLSLPALGKVVTPYAFTGPSFSFLLNTKDLTGDMAKYFERNTVDVAWNLGVGVELFSHLQVGASYGWGMNKILKKVGEYAPDYDYSKYMGNGKKNCWTVTAAYLF